MRTLLFLLLPFLFTVHAYDLTVIINEVEVGKGNVMVGLFDKQKGFPDRQFAFTGAEVEDNATSVSVTIDDLDLGTYAVAVFQDTSHTGKLQTDILGIPTVPFGFSTNANSVIGPPTFANAKFNLKGNRTITVNLFTIVGDELKEGTKIIE